MYRGFISLVFCILSYVVQSQTIVEYDYMETSSPTYTTAGWFVPAASAGWFNNASVTPTLSAVIYGLGSGTSTIEQDWYSMSNVTLNPSRSYQLKFKLASYTFSNSTATSRGVDAADYISVQLSTDGGVTYVNELRITGNSNATWPYTATGTITHTANGVFTNSAAPAGDVYQSPAGASVTGPSTVTLNLAANTSQVAIDIYCRINSAGEEWWIDNIELWDITPTPLPVELMYFEGTAYPLYNVLKWATATEHNSQRFDIERSVDGVEWKYVGQKEAAINSTEQINYSYIDSYMNKGFVYYRLQQYDNDGVCETYGPIALYHMSSQKKIVKYLNSLGQEVSSDTKGLIIIVYDDGTSEKTIK